MATTTSYLHQLQQPQPQQAHLSKLPVDLYQWSTWRPSNDEPLTPPPSALEQGPYSRLPFPSQPTQSTSASSVSVGSTTGTVLPPISHLDRFARPPTPPYDNEVAPTSSRPSPELAPIQSRVSNDTGLSSDYSDYMMGAPTTSSTTTTSTQVEVTSPTPAPYSHPIDWFGNGQKDSSHLLAEKTCEMICYMWFSPAPATSSPSSPPSPPVSASASSLQLAASPGFVQFMQKVLETTQVSEAVIVLALHYIYALKERNRTAHGQAGSEFRVSVVGLMLANKFVDDNTYTNKTWSEVSGIELVDINRMEREFLKGLGFTLYVDKARYESWLKLLKGLVHAKERALRDWHHVHHRVHDRHHVRAHRASRAHGSHSRPPRAHPSPSHQRSPAQAVFVPRARSTSPCRPLRPTVGALPPLAVPTPEYAGAKRSADVAFSPSAAAAAYSTPEERPAKGIRLEIPAAPVVVPSSHEVSPLEPLQSFARLSLGNGSPASANEGAALAAPYRVDPSRQLAVPQSLYYYSIACSPTAQPADAVVEPEDRDNWRRARLRHHQPVAAPAPVPAPAVYGASLACPQPPAYAPYVQSASSSPAHSRGGPRLLAPVPQLAMQPSLSLPSAHDPVWRAPSYGSWMPAAHGQVYVAQSARTSPVAYAYAADWQRGRAH